MFITLGKGTKKRGRKKIRLHFLHEEKGKDALPHERVARFVGFFAGKLRDTTNTVVDKVMEMPNNFAGRWMVINVAFGMAFHLLPIAFMFFLTATYNYNI